MFLRRETKSFEMPFIAAWTSSALLGLLQTEDCELKPVYSLAATCVFFEVARTFSKSSCDNGLGTCKV